MAGVRISFTFHADEFSRALMNYARAVQNGKPKGEIVREQMKFAIRAIIDLTPFETLAQGRAVVHRDLLRAVKPYGGEDGSFSKITNDGIRERLRGYLRSSQYDKIKEVFSKIGAKGYYAGFEMVDFDPSLHHRWQNSRGHVESEHKVLTPQVRQWRDYLEHLQGQVGRARGGWAASAKATGLSLPDWVTRWESGGSASVRIEPSRVTFEFVNRAIFIPRYRERIEVALAGREKAMAGDLRRFMDGEASHAGFGR
jgi:hypothetical protein